MKIDWRKWHITKAQFHLGVQAAGIVKTGFSESVNGVRLEGTDYGIAIFSKNDPNKMELVSWTSTHQASCVAATDDASSDVQ